METSFWRRNSGTSSNQGNIAQSSTFLNRFQRYFLTLRNINRTNYLAQIIKLPPRCRLSDSLVSLVPHEDPSISPSIRSVKSCARLITEDDMLHILFHACPSPFYPQTPVSRTQRMPFCRSSVILFGSQQPISFCYRRLWKSCLFEKSFRCLTRIYEYFAQITCSHTVQNFTSRIVVCEEMNFSNIFLW